ncbi:hypothetical protein [Tenacibaculum halocynthiae]|uniref:hypothetical protein n=1 Tax=Tenacibaculum halocynthiae TaxID=1254437 RepID=UPI0038B666EA
METIKRILILNKRSQYAYEEYLNQKKYYQAKRIYSSNKEIISLLKELQFSCDSELIEDVFQYIFHLEDWFLQFHEEEKKITNIESSFIFDRLENSFNFPLDFYKKIKK